MSNSPKNLMNTNSSFEQVKSNDDTSSSNCTGKRSVSEDLEVQTKKIKIETPVLGQNVLMASTAVIAPPKFVSAASMVAPIPEISDEELLEFTLEYERKHGI